jgi:predicted glycosyltransferase
VARRITYTGYLRREVPPEPVARYPKLTKQPFILVTTGGGGDGDALVDWVISAYEADPSLTMPALIVFGPYIGREAQQAFLARISRHPRLDALSFNTKLELLMQKAAGVVAMGGYNTFCEILSLDKPALIVPRTRPRLEQFIRAQVSERLGLVRVLHEADGGREPQRMAAALHGLPSQPRPSQIVVPGLLDGLEIIRARFGQIILNRPAALTEAAE